jgi:hypothetical protein
VKHRCTIVHALVGALLFMLRWDWYAFDKKRVETRYTELVFLHPMGSNGHVVHFGMSGARNGDALFFMLEWDRYGFHKKCNGTCYAEYVLFMQCIPVHLVHEMLRYYFSCSGGTGTNCTKSAPEHVTPNMCFCIRWVLWDT